MTLREFIKPIHPMEVLDISIGPSDEKYDSEVIGVYAKQLQRKNSKYKYLLDTEVEYFVSGTTDVSLASREMKTLGDSGTCIYVDLARVKK